MPSNTTYNPPNTASITQSAVHTLNPGISANPTAGTTTNIDYTLSDDCLMTGVWFILNGAAYGDSVVAQIVDISGTYAPAGTVIQQFINTWYIPAQGSIQIDSAYPAKVLAGLTLRIVYTSTGVAAPFVGVNYKLHKVLL